MKRNEEVIAVSMHGEVSSHGYSVSLPGKAKKETDHWSFFASSEYDSFRHSAVLHFLPITNIDGGKLFGIDTRNGVNIFCGHECEQSITPCTESMHILN